MTRPAAESQVALLDLARRAVEAAVRGTSLPTPDDRAVRAGAFVTICQDERLRGCIGVAEARQPLTEAVIRCACAAALDDPRFPPLQPDDLPYVRIEVSVLGPLTLTSDPSLIEIGRHGVAIELGDRRGLFLPKVAVEHGWNREQLLCEACRKAGLPPDAWRTGAQLYLFETETFREP